MYYREVRTLADRVAERFRNSEKPMGIILREEVDDEVLRNRVARELQRRATLRRMKNNEMPEAERVRRPPVQLVLALVGGMPRWIKKRKKANPHGCA